MKRVTNISPYAKITFQGEYKIGIATSTKSRNNQVNKAIRGKVVVLSRRTLPAAYKLEQRLHKLFGDSRFRIKGGRRGGVTEWFYMNPAEYRTLELWLWYFQYKLQIDIAIIALISSIPTAIYILWTLK